MDRIPLGISRLDDIIGGGAPAGSVVLLASEPGAGGREFGYTAALMNALARADPEEFRFYYGPLADEATVPEHVHYVSFTNSEQAVVDEMRFVLEDDLVDRATSELTITDLSTEFFQLTSVPTGWYTETSGDITTLGDRTSKRGVLEALATHLTANAPGNLVVIDSLSDLVTIASESERITWSDLTIVLKGLKRASHRWGGLVCLLVTEDVLSSQEFGHLKDSTDGTLVFEWESGGSARDRTMVV